MIEKYYKEAIDILVNSSFDPMSIVKDYAKQHPADFVKAARDPNDPLNPCRKLMAEGKKIEAIKHYRNETGVTLKDAKAAVESL